MLGQFSTKEAAAAAYNKAARENLRWRAINRGFTLNFSSAKAAVEEAQKQSTPQPKPRVGQSGNSK